ncbi:hypothetical protein SBADM41S_04074 [Streptomyces badius]
MTKTTACALAALAALAPAVALAPAAVADDSSSGDHAITLHATLNPFKVNKVTGSGTARVHLEGNKAHVMVKHSGLLAGAPHAQHFHINAKGVCPPKPPPRRATARRSSIPPTAPPSTAESAPR